MMRAYTDWAIIASKNAEFFEDRGNRGWRALFIEVAA
jgi:hypothetical protein